MQSRKLLIAGAVLVIITGVAVFMVLQMREEKRAFEFAKEPMFPGLREKLGSVSRVRLSDSERVLTVEKTDGRWGWVESGGYPVRGEQIDELMVNFAELIKIEAKTANPQNYHLLGLQDPEAEGSPSKQIEFIDSSGKALGTIIVGNQKTSRGTIKSAGYYVRVPGENQTWLVEGQAKVHRSLMSYINPWIANVDYGRIDTLAVSYAEEPEMSVRMDRPTSASVNLELVNVPEGKIVPDAIAADRLGRSFSNLTFLEVKPLSELNIEGLKPDEIEITTFDGLVLNIKKYNVGGTEWVVLSAAANEQLLKRREELEKQGNPDGMKKTADVRKEIADIQAISGFGHTMPEERITNTFRKLSDFIADPPTMGPEFPAPMIDAPVQESFDGGSDEELDPASKEPAAAPARAETQYNAPDETGD